MTWPAATLDDVVESVNYGFTASATNEPLGPKFLRITDIQDGDVNWQSVPYSSEHPPTDSLRLRPGDIVFARTGATTGKSFLIRDCPTNSIFASYLIRVRASSAIDPLYLAHFFQSTDYWTQIKLAANGAAQPGINSTVLRRLRVPLPPLAEQRRIAAILDPADDLRRKRRLALEKLNTLPQVIFQEMFGDVASRSQKFTRAKLSDVCKSVDDIRCGPFGTQLLREEFTDGGTPLWGIRHVNSGFAIQTSEYVSPQKAVELKQYSLIADDIVMTRKGTIGNCAVYPRTFPLGIMHSDLLRVRVNSEVVNPSFVSEQLHWSRDIERQLSLISGGAIMPGINVGRLRSIEILIPPKPLQDLFALRLKAVDASRQLFNTSLAQLDRLFASLQHHAFAGTLGSSSAATALSSVQRDTEALGV